jgi:hypothetical protein
MESYLQKEYDKKNPVVPQSCMRSDGRGWNDRSDRYMRWGFILADLKHWGENKPYSSIPTLLECLGIMESVITPDDFKLVQYGEIKARSDRHARNIFLRILFWQNKETLLKLYSVVFPRFPIKVSVEKRPYLGHDKKIETKMEPMAERNLRFMCLLMDWLLDKHYDDFHKKFHHTLSEWGAHALYIPFPISFVYNNEIGKEEKAKTMTLEINRSVAPNFWHAKAPWNCFEQSLSIPSLVSFANQYYADKKELVRMEILNSNLLCGDMTGLVFNYLHDNHAELKEMGDIEEMLDFFIRLGV